MNNKFNLDDYTYNLLLNYFKSNKKIQSVKIHGSRLKGNCRKASDIDLLIEGDFSEIEYAFLKKELNSLKHPYKIDLFDFSKKDQLTEELIIHNCEYIYNPLNQPLQKEYHKTYEKSWMKLFELKYRLYIEVKEMFNDFFQKCENEYIDIQYQIFLFSKFKYCYELIWRFLKKFLKEEYNIVILLPREIIKKCSELNIIKNDSVWYSMIYDFNIMTDEPYLSIKNELSYRTKNFYFPEFENLIKTFKNKH